MSRMAAFQAGGKGQVRAGLERAFVRCRNNGIDCCGSDVSRKALVDMVAAKVVRQTIAVDLRACCKARPQATFSMRVRGSLC